MKKTNIVRGGKKCGSIKFYKKNRVAPRVYISFNICISVAAGDIFFGGGAVGRRGLNITQQ